MIRLLIIAAAIVAAAAAAGEAQIVLGGDCGCGAGIQTYSTATAAYCPTSSYPTCDITKMIHANCKISCDGVRSNLVYRNNSAIWLTTSSISCVNGEYKTSEGAKLVNLLRPTCAFKASCDDCATSFEPSCPTGMTCKAGNLEQTTDTDGCGRMSCKTGSLRLYTEDHLPMAYTATKLYCNTAKKWTNYSLDGSTVGGTQINDIFHANCVLPKTCEECVSPAATELSQLPIPFRTGYILDSVIHFKEEGSCSEISCNSGYALYGFSGSVTNVTGHEYTNKGWMQCDGTTHWTNGGQVYTPSNLIVACLKDAPTTTTTTVPTTTPNQCGAYDNVDIGGGSVVCVNGQNRIKCDQTGKKIEVFDAEASKLFEHMTFVSGKGWMSFDCTGNARIWNTGKNEIVAVACEGFI